MTKLQQLRKERGISQAKFAKHFGVAQNTVSNWESGNRAMDGQILSKMADFFDVSIDYLMGKSDIRRMDRSDIGGNDDFIRALANEAQALNSEHRDQIMKMVIFLKQQQKEIK